MEVTAVVLHRGALAQYSVSDRGGNRFDARLLSYSGDPASSPPQEVSLEKQGRHCVGSIPDEELLDDIYDAAKEKFKGGA